jgi:CysZ protein
MSILGALGYGLINLFHPRMLWLMVWPMLAALAFWGAVALLLWIKVALWLAGVLRGWLEPALGFVRLDFGDATLIAAHVILFLLFVPIVYLTGLFILGVFGMPRMVEHAAGAFPALERRRGGSAAGSVWNAIVALCGMMLAFLVSLPLWLIPPLWPLIPLVIMAWVNQRLLRYDALAEHAERAEMAQLFRQRFGALYLLGFLLGLVAYIPFVGLLAPAVFALAYIRYLLGALEQHRLSTPIASI